MAKKKKKREERLTPQQKLFVHNVVSGMSLVDSYKEAGYKCTQTSAHGNATRLSKRPMVAAAIRSAIKKVAKKAEITQARVLEEEKLIAFSDIGSFWDLESGTLLTPDQLPEEIRRVVASFQEEHLIDGRIKYRYKLWDKGKSLERIEKYLGMFEKDNEQKRDQIIISPETFEKPDNAGT